MNEVGDGRVLAVLVVLVAASVGCGGIAVFDDDGGGGSGPTATTTAVTSSAEATSSTGTGGCSSHEECGDQLCIFATGTCAPSCDPEGCDSCGPGRFCEECTTSSCPGCRDCVAACTPADGRCDDDDPCREGSICHFGEGRCSGGCNAQGACDDLEYVCSPCETRSCCGCKDCVGGCIVPEE